MSKRTVTKSNKIIKAGYRLSLIEQRLMLQCISEIDPQSPEKINDTYNVRVKDYADYYQLDLKTAYRDV